MKRRVVITGMGCVTPIGNTTSDFETGLHSGRVGVGRLTLFDAERFPVRIAAEIRDWDVNAVARDGNRWQRCPRQTQFAIGAGLQAARQSGIDDAAIDPQRFGVYLGCGEPFEDFNAFTQCVHLSLQGDECTSSAFLDTALRVFDPDVEREFEPDLPAIHLAGLLNAQGPVANCIAACVSSTQAIGESMRMIQQGETDIMLCGGAHSTIHPFGVTGFQRLSALSQRNDDPQAAVRPFDADRDGFVIGEGAAAFIVEEREHALRRGAEILGEITGYGSSQDAFRVTDSHPEGRGTEAAIKRALASAGLNPEDIDYINAHGTGTIMNDRVETAAIKRAFGQQAYRIPVSSTKSMLGHATTACGAIELAVCVISLRTGVIPPTINHETPDADCDLDYVPYTAREVSCRHVLTNNIGFGGQNAALIVSRYDEASRGVVPSVRAA
ncbi:MAG TPA: beta-ketoacyl-[acyl-carrier-protein] synthase family protein [Planctomycetes bacterium]|nr:beta-ketoacyl-[acyl-carrier-protein] synthase family protein [Fuerstiella sp.]HIK90829.1 beta-ketoacyl-[acyl-carrier-protein] synthase family protein [Planctomycetota bacterium]